MAHSEIEVVENEVVVEGGAITPRSLNSQFKIDNSNRLRSRVEYGKCSEALAATNDTVCELRGTLFGLLLLAVVGGLYALSSSL